LKLQERLSILSQLSEYLGNNPPAWQQAKQRATIENAWFVPQFIDNAVDNINRYFLDSQLLKNWVNAYQVPDENPHPATIGLTMAGNIPLVGFHDWLTVFVSGHRQLIKPSSKDSLLITHIIDKLKEWNPDIGDYMKIAERINGCDAYIATGSNNSGRYFEYYFGRYPHIIRKNRTSAAILTGNETKDDLQQLADDVLMYFGLGCRNVSKLYVPHGYAFEPLLQAFGKYGWMKDHDKFKNNYDYQLSLLLLNNQYYMSNDILLFIENEALFSAISRVHYEYYDAMPEPGALLSSMEASLQCLCGVEGNAFGRAQQPSLKDYADGVDTMDFCLKLKK
jgi:hypothetical protein